MRGSGRTELVRAIFGADPHHGTLVLAGKDVHVNNPMEAIRHRVALATEDRKLEGLFLQNSAKNNISISGLKDICWGGFVIRPKEELARVLKLIKSMMIKTPGPDFPVSNMSGGNQRSRIVAMSFCEPRS